jgi:hypothetical protein
MSKILRTVLRAMRDLHAVGCITDEKMKEFEELCRPEGKKASHTPRKGKGRKAGKHIRARKPK